MNRFPDFFCAEATLHRKDDPIVSRLKNVSSFRVLLVEGRFP
jgi:hypothetical protein